MADVNGDGYLDIVTFGEKDVNNPRIRLTTQPTPDLLTSVTDGLGTNVSFTYATLMDNAVYDEGTATATYPERIIRDTVDTYVVKQVTSDNGIGGTLSTSYKYESGRIHHEGYGHLGFAKVTETDDATGIKTIMFNRQDYPYIGDVYRTETRLSNNQLLSETDVTPQFTRYGGKWSGLPVCLTTNRENL